MNLRYLPSYLLAALVLLLPATDLAAQPFVNPVPIPYKMTGSTFNLTVDTNVHNFNPNVPGDSINVAIPTFCYNAQGQSGMTYLGPTMFWQKGTLLNISINNRLPGNETTVHWHGLNLPAEDDGGPHEIIEAGTTWQPDFTLIDPVQTVWYHSHLMDSTTEQVILGLAGMIIIEDTLNDMTRPFLPRDYGQNDFPLVLQEKGFTSAVNGKVTGMVVGNAPGNGPFTVVNGVMNGTLNVPAELLRFRFLNGSPRKSFQVGVSQVLVNPEGSDFEAMWLIATDGGYTAIPHLMDSLLISPGERMEMLVNCSGMNHGDTLYLSNLVRSIPSDVVSGGGPPPSRGTLGDAFMALVIDTSIHSSAPVFSAPTTLAAYSVDTSDIFKRRVKVLMGSSGSGGVWTIDGQPMDMNLINDTLLVNKKEMWTIKNTTNIAHPFHIHKVQFQVVSVTDSFGTTSVYPNIPDYLKGYKDDVLIRAKTSLTFIARFDSFPSMILDPTMSFMYHCHILPHEDNSMMHQFVVVDSMTYYGSQGMDLAEEATSPMLIYPNPAASFLHLKGTTNENGTLRFIDVLGRNVYEAEVEAFEGSTTLPVANLPRGLFFVEWTCGTQRMVQKLVLE